MLIFLSLPLVVFTEGFCSSSLNKTFNFPVPIRSWASFDLSKTAFNSSAVGSGGAGSTPISKTPPTDTVWL